MDALIQLTPAAPRLPEWLRKPRTHSESVHNLKTELRRLNLHTVCESARCPNMHECFHRGTATFMILGNLCTRGCGFCSVPKSRHPGPLDPQEPANVARMAKDMQLRHVVVTSVNRDDLADGGSEHFAATVRELSRALAQARVEVLTPDFQGDLAAVARVLDAGPHIFNHNMETVRRLYGRVRPQADYRQSLDVLQFAKGYRPDVLTKSGAMIGLGETPGEVHQLLRDLRAADVDIATLGQYLQPTRRNLPVTEFVRPTQFDAYRDFGLSLGFKMVFSGPLVRSLLHGGFDHPVNLALSLLSAVLLILIFPDFNYTLLAPAALAPLLVACDRERSWKRRFVLGWASGFLFWFSVCYWIQFVLEVHGGMGRWGGWGTFVLFALLKGLYTAAFAALVGNVLRTPWAIPGAAALWTAVEYAHGTIGLAWIGLGFAWLDLGNAAIDMPLLPRLAPITGVWGLSFVLAMMSSAVALAVLRRPLTHYASLAALALLPLLPALPPLKAGTERVRVVQPNIDIEAEWTRETMDILEQRMVLLSKPAGAPLIVWPEAPAPFYPADESFREYMSDLARDAQATILFGGLGRTPTGEPLNSAFLFINSGELAAERYDKIRLVPFGEYVPDAFGWVNRIVPEISDFVPGTRIVTFPVDGHRLGAFICYESAFPDLVRQFTQAGAAVLVNLSNDGYFGRSAAREQHLKLVRMRAAENRRWILRATNDGITAMIDPAGREIARLPLYTQTSAVFSYNPETALTPYVRFGDWFAWTCLLGAAVNCVLLRARRRP